MSKIAAKRIKAYFQASETQEAFYPFRSNSYLGQNLHDVTLKNVNLMERDRALTQDAGFQLTRLQLLEQFVRPSNNERPEIFH